MYIHSMCIIHNYVLRTLFRYSTIGVNNDHCVQLSTSSTITIRKWLSKPPKLAKRIDDNGFAFLFFPPPFQL